MAMPDSQQYHQKLCLVIYEKDINAYKLQPGSMEQKGDITETVRPTI